MNETQFRSNTELRSRLSEFLSDDTIGVALSIVQTKLACRKVNLSDPEIASTRAHAHYMGMKDTIDALLNLSLPNPAQREQPDATYLTPIEEQ